MTTHAVFCVCEECIDRKKVPHCLCDDEYHGGRARALEAHGWLVRVRTRCHGAPLGWMACTEGLVRKLGHADFELAVPMSAARAHSILITCALSVAIGGVTFYPGPPFPDVLANGFDVRFAWNHDGSSKRLRIILPDTHNHTERHLMSGRLALQWKVTESYRPPAPAPQAPSAGVGAGAGGRRTPAVRRGRGS